MTRIYFFLLVVLSKSITTMEENKVLVHFQPNETASVDSYIRYKGDFPTLSEFTTCFRVFLQQFKTSSMPIISYGTLNQSNDLSIAICRDCVEIHCCNRNSSQIRIPVLVHPIRWTSICMSFDTNIGILKLAINGRIIKENLQTNTDNETLKLNGGQVLTLGKSKDIGNYNRSTSTQLLRGLLTDFQIADSLIDESEMHRFMTCETNQVASAEIVSFHNHFEQFDTINVKICERLMQSVDICQPTRPRVVLLSTLHTFVESYKLCKAIGATMHIPRNEDENRSLFKLAASYYGKFCRVNNTRIVWLGAVSQNKSDNFYKYSTKQLLNYSKPMDSFTISEEQNCVSLHSSNDDSQQMQGVWKSGNCLQQKCPVCQYEKLEILKLRGLCGSSLFDKEYFVVIEEQNVVFRGLYFSSIYKRHVNDNNSDADIYWELSRPDMPEITAQTISTEDSHYPVGKNEWIVHGDHCGVRQVILTLTICNGSQFTCSDGSCISKHYRCDRQINCSDRSDEEDCEIIQIPEKYDSTVPPPKIHHDHPINVSVLFEIYSVRSFELKHFKIIVDAKISMSWRDTRLTFKNLKEESSLNNVKSSSLKPWVPAFQILGTGNMTSDHKDRLSSLCVMKYSDALLDDDANYQEDELYSGSENPLKLERSMTIETSCHFQLEQFPFDIQMCTIIVLLSENPSKYIQLVTEGNGVLFLGEKKLLEYLVTSTMMEDYRGGIFSGKQITIVFENLVTFYITSTFVPTLIMLLIGCMTFSFPIKDFTNRIMVALTSLLVEAAFFTQVSESIPKTAHLKFIDIWFVTCIVSLFIIISLLTAINYLYCLKDYRMVTSVSSTSSSSTIASKRNSPRYNFKVLAININKTMIVACPTAILLVVILYFAIAMQFLKHGF